MSQFLYLYRMADAARQEAMGTPERAQQSMQRWMAWMNELDRKGHLKDRGQPLERTGKVVRGQQKTVTDGPFTEAKDLVGGFTVVEARDIEPAVAKSRGQSVHAAVRHMAAGAVREHEQRRARRHGRRLVENGNDVRADRDVEGLRVHRFAATATACGTRSNAESLPA